MRYFSWKRCLKGTRSGAIRSEIALSYIPLVEEYSSLTRRTSDKGIFFYKLKLNYTGDHRIGKKKEKKTANYDVMS